MTLTAGQSAALARWGIDRLEQVDDHPFAWGGRRGAPAAAHTAAAAAPPGRAGVPLGPYRPAAATSVVEHDVTLGLLVTRRVLPGDDIRPLARTDDDAATREIAALAARLHSCQSGVADLPHLREIGTAFDRAEDPRIPQGLIADARRVFLELMADEVDPVVLHGDLQHLNVLNTGDGWRAIDPHGWIGDPAFESAALLANPRGLIEGGDARGMDGSELARKARRRAEIYAEVTGYDTDRLRWWGFVGCVIAELWMIESHDLVHGAPLAVAEVLRAG